MCGKLWSGPYFSPQNQNPMWCSFYSSRFWKKFIMYNSCVTDPACKRWFQSNFFTSRFAQLCTTVMYRGLNSIFHGLGCGFIPGAISHQAVVRIPPPWGRVRDRAAAIHGEVPKGSVHPAVRHRCPPVPSARPPAAVLRAERQCRFFVFYWFNSRFYLQNCCIVIDIK